MINQHSAAIERSHIKEALQLQFAGSRSHKAGMLIKGAISLLLALSVLQSNLELPSEFLIGGMDMSVSFKWGVVTFAFIASFMLCYCFFTIMSRRARRRNFDRITDDWVAKTGGSMQVVLAEDKFLLRFENGRSRAISLSSVIRIIDSPGMVVFLMADRLVIPFPKQGDWKQAVDRVKAKVP